MENQTKQNTVTLTLTDLELETIWEALMQQSLNVQDNIESLLLSNDLSNKTQQKIEHMRSLVQDYKTVRRKVYDARYKGTMMEIMMEI